jgi:hypothetical protein
VSTDSSTATLFFFVFCPHARDERVFRFKDDAQTEEATIYRNFRIENRRSAVLTRAPGHEHPLIRCPHKSSYSSKLVDEGCRAKVVFRSVFCRIQVGVFRSVFLSRVKRFVACDKTKSSKLVI